MEMKYHSRAIPSIPVTSKHFHYTPAVQTDVTETWKRFGWVPTTKRGNINKPVMGKTK